MNFDCTGPVPWLVYKGVPVIRMTDMADMRFPSLSILIPVYRCDVSLLVEEIKNQAEIALEEWEVILLDDASGTPWSDTCTKLADHPNVFCHTVEINMGRSAARNRLVSLATKEVLLFIDGDAGMLDPDYLSKMVGSLKSECVVSGKTVYTDKRPLQPEKILRWKYGKRRESVPASVRNKHPWQSFSTFHFAGAASILKRIPFRTQHRGYGHEDTLFGFDLQQAEIPVIHTDIPLLHTGIDDADIFLQKSAEAVEHLTAFLQEEGCSSPPVSAFRMLRFYCRHRWWLEWLPIRRLLNHLYPGIYARLTGGTSTSLWSFDLYKLIYLIKMMRDSVR